MSFFNGLKDFFMPNEDEYAEPTEPVTKKEPEQPAACCWWLQGYSGGHSGAVLR